MFKRIDHIGVVVRDLKTATDAFENLFGLKVAAQEVIEERGLIAALVPTSNVRFELMQPTNPESAVGRFIERRGEGIQHICFEVDDIRATIETLKGRDVQLIQGEPEGGFVGEVEFIHPRAANGVLTEIAQVTRRTPVDHDLRVHHVTISTTDRDGAVENWSKSFDMKVNRMMERESAGMSTGWLDAGDAEVEFAQQTTETGPIASAIASRGVGVYGIVLETSDAEALAKHVKSQGVRIVEEHEGDRVLRVVHPKDFFGTLIMINQRR